MPVPSTPAMDASRSLCSGALLCGTGVALGALAAHGLKPHLSAEQMDAFQTGVRYQMLHGLALLACAALGPARRTALAARAFLAGTLLFSGSLYVLALSGPTWSGAVTPVGGVLMIAGWAALLLQNLPRRPSA
jgi:uncharacterized membrane protein YgdD (TMEM256/DUF423 family)